MTPAFAAIDIGSNTLRMMIAAPTEGSPPWRLVEHVQVITRLGEGLHRHGRLSAEAMARSIERLREFSARLKHHGVSQQRVYAVATAAVREAANGQAFLARLMKEAGIRAEVIAGDAEADLSLQGVCAALAENTCADFLLFDIGGGSTEFVRANHGMRVDAISRKLGVVRLVEAHLQGDPPPVRDYSAMLHVCRQHLAAVESFWGDTHRPAHLVGTAGTVTSLAALHLGLDAYDANRVNNHAMPLADLMLLRDRLLRLTHQERAALPAIGEGRADLIIAGMAIVEAVMRHWRYRTLIAMDAGLLEGVWLAAAELGKPAA